MRVIFPAYSHIVCVYVCESEFFNLQCVYGNKDNIISLHVWERRTISSEKWREIMLTATTVVAVTAATSNERSFVFGFLHIRRSHIVCHREMRNNEPLVAYHPHIKSTFLTWSIFPQFIPRTIRTNIHICLGLGTNGVRISQRVCNSEISPFTLTNDDRLCNKFNNFLFVETTSASMFRYFYGFESSQCNGFEWKWYLIFNDDSHVIQFARIKNANANCILLIFSSTADFFIWTWATSFLIICRM